MTTYFELLQHPKWQEKRLKILERDNWHCIECKAEEVTLHVHHKRYEKGRKPWEYDDDVLCTLCKDCHKFEEHLKSSNPEFALLAKAANVTCLRMWKWVGSLSFLKKYHPEDYQVISDTASGILVKHGSIIWAHASNPMQEIYGEEIHG